MFLNEITRLDTTIEKIGKYVDTTIETTKKKKKNTVYVHSLTGSFSSQIFNFYLTVTSNCLTQEWKHEWNMLSGLYMVGVIDTWSYQIYIERQLFSCFNFLRHYPMNRLTS